MKEIHVYDPKKELSTKQFEVPCVFSKTGKMFFNQDGNIVAPTSINGKSGVICKHKDGISHFVECDVNKLGENNGK